MTIIETPRIEAALLAALAELHASRGGSLRTLRGFNGPWRAARAAGAAVAPALLVRYDGWRPPTPDAGQLGGWSRWCVTLAVGGGMDEAGRRLGIGGGAPELSPGAAWPLLEAIRSRLLRRILLPGLGPLHWHGEKPAEPDTGLSVWEQTWECSMPPRGSLPPVMALAQGGASALLSAVGAGEEYFAPADGIENFHPGDPLFLANVDAGDNHYLGRIVLIEAGEGEEEDRLRAERPAPVAFPDGAMLWTPGACFEWSAGRQPPWIESWDRGAECIRTADGGAVTSRWRTPRRSMAFAVGPLPAAEAEAFRVWVAVALRGGLDPFTWADEYGAVARAWMQTPELEERRADDGFVSLRLTLALGEPGTRA